MSIESRLKKIEEKTKPDEREVHVFVSYGIMEDGSRVEVKFPPLKPLNPARGVCPEKLDEQDKSGDK